MNAGGVDKACKSNGSCASHKDADLLGLKLGFARIKKLSAYIRVNIRVYQRPRAKREVSGERVSNTLVTYPEVRHNESKDSIIPHNVSSYFCL